MTVSTVEAASRPRNSSAGWCWLGGSLVAASCLHRPWRSPGCGAWLILPAILVGPGSAGSRSSGSRDHERHERIAHAPSEPSRRARSAASTASNSREAGRRTGTSRRGSAPLLRRRPPLREPRQPVVRDRLPDRGVSDVRPVAGRIPGSPSNAPSRTDMISGSSGLWLQSAEPQAEQNTFENPSRRIARPDQLFARLDAAASPERCAPRPTPPVPVARWQRVQWQ